jgi:hypothetical protein
MMALLCHIKAHLKEIELDAGGIVKPLLKVVRDMV